MIFLVASCFILLNIKLCCQNFPMTITGFQAFMIGASGARKAAERKKTQTKVYQTNSYVHQKPVPAHPHGSLGYNTYSNTVVVAENKGWFPNIVKGITRVYQRARDFVLVLLKKPTTPAIKYPGNQ